MLVNNYSDKIISSLLLINSGGAVAVLSFIGTTKSIQNKLSIWLSLFSFSIGLVFAITLKIYLLHKIDWIFFHWRHETSKFYTDQIDWNNLINNDDKRSWGNKIGYRLGYIAFFGFLFGLFAGFLASPISKLLYEFIKSLFT